MSLTKPRMWIVGTVLVCLILTLAAYFLLIGPKRAEAADLRIQTDAAATSNDRLQIQVTELKAQFAELPQREAELAAIKQALPESAQLQLLTRELEKTAEVTGVTLTGITPSVPVPVIDPAAVVAPPAPAPAAPAGAEAPVAATPVPAPPTSILAAVPTVVTVVGSFENSEAFLEAVQTSLGRDFLIQSLNVVAQQKAEAATGGRPAVENGDVTVTITGSVFVLQPAAVVVPVAVAAPAPTTTP